MSLLPHSSNYSRLEVDDKGIPGPGMKKRFNWKKFALVASALIAIVWLFGPRERRRKVLDATWGGQPEPYDEGYDASPAKPTLPPHYTIPSDSDIGDVPNTGGPGKTVEDVEGVGMDMDPTRPSYSDSDSGSYNPNDNANTPTYPTSPETDPNPLGTVHCTHPYNDDLRIVQYALMIDAGSTGSRIHIYKFNNCGPSAAYEYEVFMQTQPGLSKYAGEPVRAAESLDALMEKAVQVVPQKLQACTPVAVKATAGLRLLGLQESADILEAVRVRLQDNYPFPVVEKDGVVIMDGKDEGVYAWITANYLLNTIRADSPTGSPAYAVLDLGGASTQIVFEPTMNADVGGSMEPGDHIYELQFGGKTHVLYQHSYLGYGLMQARKSVHRLVDFVSSMNYNPSNDAEMTSAEVPNPCLAKGTSRVVEIEATRPGEVAKNVTMAGLDVGGYPACNHLVELVLAKNAICRVKPCSFDGVYQPSILDAFPTGNILLLSYFYDRISPFYEESERSSLTVASIADLAVDVCKGHTTWYERWVGNDALLTELEGRPEWCLDLTFMHALLRLGYEFGDERSVRMEKKIEGTELGWCLGAAIAIVGGELTCRV